MSMERHPFCEGAKSIYACLRGMSQSGIVPASQPGPRFPRAASRVCCTPPRTHKRAQHTLYSAHTLFCCEVLRLATQSAVNRPHRPHPPHVSLPVLVFRSLSLSITLIARGSSPCPSSLSVSPDPAAPFSPLSSHSALLLAHCLC